MLIVFKFKKPGASFANVDEATANAKGEDVPENATRCAELNNQEASLIANGGFSQPFSYELVGTDTLIVVAATTRLVNKIETDFVIARIRNAEAAGWELYSLESNGQVRVLNNGRFYSADGTLIPFYPS